MESCLSHRSIAVAALALMGQALVLPACADDSGDYLRRDDWQLNISPYVWAAGLKGTVAAVDGLPPIEIDAGFNDILRNLDLAAMTFAELRYQRFAAYADIIYTHISADSETERQVLVDDIDVTNEMFIGTFGGAYRALEGDRGFVDLLAGARVWSVDTSVKLDGGLLGDRRIEDNQNWVDPIVGVKGRFAVGAGFSLYGLAQAGGFGAASDITWDVFGGALYEFNDTVSAIAGYRHLEVDYRNGAFHYDVELSGPVIGATIRF